MCRPIVILNAISCFVTAALFILLGNVFGQYGLRSAYKYYLPLNGRVLILGVGGVVLLGLCVGFLIRGIRYEEGFPRWASVLLCGTSAIYGLFLLFCAMTYRYTFVQNSWGYMGARLMSSVIPSVLCALVFASGIALIITLLRETPIPAVIILGSIGILMLLIAMLVFLSGMGSYLVPRGLYTFYAPVSFALLGAEQLVAEIQKNRRIMR